MIVNTLKMCTGDAGPEQSLVLFLDKTASSSLILWDVTLYDEVTDLTLTLLGAHVHEFQCNQCTALTDNLGTTLKR